MAEHQQRVAALHCAAGEDGHRAGIRVDGGGDQGTGVGECVEG